MKQTIKSILRLLALRFELICVTSLVATSPLLSADALHSHDWPTFGRDNTNQRFSPLNQINHQTVTKLVPKWIYQTGSKGSFQTQALVIDGVMYITVPGNDVVALDAATGEEKWRYRHKSRKQKTKGGPANRGAAIARGKVFEATNDGRLIALDQNTGKIVWDRIIVTPTIKELIGLSPEERQVLHKNIDELPAKMAPLVAGDVVIVGVTSAGYGIFYNFDSGTEDKPKDAKQFLGKRGFIGAYDINTGVERWRWYTTKSGAWEGEFRATTPDGETLQRDIEREKALAEQHKDSWRIGGSSTWMTPSFDLDLGLIFVGTGNASPNDVFTARPGDNLYANSLVAIDVKSGATRWHYQQVPHDLWGYDVASTSVLFEYSEDDEKIPAIAVAGKTGWVYAHDRRDGRLLFKSEPVVPQSNLFKAPTEQGVLASPGSFGGVSWSPTSYDQAEQLFFVAAIHKPSRYFLRHAQYNGKKNAIYRIRLSCGSSELGNTIRSRFFGARKDQMANKNRATAHWRGARHGW